MLAIDDPIAGILELIEKLFFEAVQFSAQKHAAT